MNRRELERLKRELVEYLDALLDGMGRVERRAAMRNYVTGLLLDGERKSVEPMAMRLVDDASEVEAMRQRLRGGERLVGRRDLQAAGVTGRVPRLDPPSGPSLM